MRTYNIHMYIYAFYKGKIIFNLRKLRSLFAHRIFRIVQKEFNLFPF